MTVRGPATWLLARLGSTRPQHDQTIRSSGAGSEAKDLTFQHPPSSLAVEGECAHAGDVHPLPREAPRAHGVSDLRNVREAPSA